MALNFHRDGDVALDGPDGLEGSLTQESPKVWLLHGYFVNPSNIIFYNIFYNILSLYCIANFPKTKKPNSNQCSR